MSSSHPIIQAVNIEDEETGEAFVVLRYPRVGGDQVNLPYHAVTFSIRRNYE